MLNLLIGLFAVQLLVVLILMYGYGRTKRKVPRSMNEVDGMTIIVPFRNEEGRMLPLLESFNEAHIPENVELLFVDDHSTDGSVRLLTSSIRVPFQLIRNEGKGKKEAIRTGVRLASHNKILTLDSDVRFNPLFIIETLFFNMQDMTIFPIRMNGNNPVQLLGSIEFSFLQLITFGMAGFEFPVLSNGANLGFRRSAFLGIDSERTDYHIPSGDDIFLLNKMKDKERDVWAVSNTDCMVTTNAPNTFSALLKQRKRWFGKMTKMISFWAVFGLFLLILSQFGLILSLFGLKESLIFFVPIGLKFFSECLIDWRTYRQLSILRFLALLFHQLYYPVYILLLLIPTKKEEKWSLTE